MAKSDDDEPVTMTKGELAALLDKRDRDAKMDPQERKVRGIVREELASALSEFFTPADDDEDDEDEGRRKQSIGGGNVLGFLTGS